MKKHIFYFLPFSLFVLPIIGSCGGQDNFSKYVNINDVLNEKDGWYQTVSSNFGGRGANEFPEYWDFRQTTDINFGHCYQRFCGNKTFIWTKDMVDNSNPNYLDIKYDRLPTAYTDPQDSTFTTQNISGSISTEGRFEQAFGYWETEARFMDKHYGWAAFWLQCASEARVGNGGKDGSEIDIFESFNWNDFQNEVRLNTMADGYGENYKEFGTSGYYVDEDGVPISEYDGSYHKYGFLWTPQAYYMFVDRKLIFSTTAPTANHSSPRGKSNLMGVCQVPVYAIFSGHMGPNDAGQTSSRAPNGLPFDTYSGPANFYIKNFVCYQNKNFLSYIKSPNDFPS